MKKERIDYLSYLLRLWRAGQRENSAWRASLESPHTGERWRFASLAGLFDFLRRQVQGSADCDERRSENEQADTG